MDALLTWESSRATRDLTAYAELRDACVGGRVKWGYSGQLHDLADRDSRFRTGLDALLAEDEAARTSERLRRTTRHAALAGQAARQEPLRLPPGVRPADPALLRIEPHPEQAPVGARRLRGASWPARRCTRSPSRSTSAESGPAGPRYKEHRQNLGWTAVAIKQMLIQPAYAGLRQHRGEIVAEALSGPR